MNKHEMAKAIVAKTEGLTVVKVKAVLDTFFEELGKEMMRGGYYSPPNFGRFETNIVKGRRCFNPATMKAMTIPPRRVVRLRIAKRLKKRMGRPQ
jgi:nucleoid DNA-binding protein